MKRLRFLICLVLVSAAALLLFAISARRSTRDYYPLEKGRSWKYQAHADGAQGTASMQMTITNMAPREMNAISVIPQRIDVGEASGFSFVRRDDRGIYEVAEQAPGEAEPRTHKVPQYHIKFPAKPGSQWQANEQVGSDGGFLQSIPITAECSIEQLDDTVTVPGGTFRALRVHCRGSARKMMPMQGMCDGMIETRVWYAAGVGMVKSVSNENIKRSSVVLYSLQQVMDLVSFSK